jgi:hypothetical protein
MPRREMINASRRRFETPTCVRCPSRPKAHYIQTGDRTTSLTGASVRARARAPGRARRQRSPRPPRPQRQAGARHARSRRADRLLNRRALTAIRGNMALSVATARRGWASAVRVLNKGPLHALLDRHLSRDRLEAELADHETVQMLRRACLGHRKWRDWSATAELDRGFVIGECHQRTG